MPTTINTRIKNRIDTLSAWTTGTNVDLLPGEIALVSVTTQQIDEATGNIVNVPAVLMKVGATYTTTEATAKGDASLAGKNKPFAELPWLSALASDVYNWAKVADPSGITVKYNKGSEASPSWQSATLADILKDLDTLESVAAGKLGDISVNPSGSGVVKSVVKDANVAGKINVTLSAVGTDDIAANAVTTGKIKDANVTDAKIATVSASKVMLSATEDLVTRLGTIEGNVAGFKGGLSVNPASATTNGVVQGVTYNSTTGVFTVTYGTVAAGDIASNAVTTAKIKDANVTTAKIADGNVTNAKIATVDAGKVMMSSTETLPTRIGIIESDISDLKAYTGKGVRFIGTVSTAPSQSSNTVTIGSTSTTAEVGDIVLHVNTSAGIAGVEYICVATTGSARWQVLGDQSRIGTLETLTGSINAASRTANQYMTHISKNSSGQLVANYAQPAASEVSYGNSNVGTALDNLAAEVAEKSDSGHEHPVYENQNAFSNIKVGSTTVAADAPKDTVEFVGSNITITPDATNDKVTFTVADAGTSTKGIVMLSDSVNSDTAAASGKTAATPKAVKTAYAKAEEALAEAKHDHPYSLNTHGHGNITNAGTITSTGVTAATGFVVYDSSNKIQRATTANTWAILRGTALGTTATTAAKGDHTHSGYESQLANIESNYVHYDATSKKFAIGAGSPEVVIFDCGGASVI